MESVSVNIDGKTFEFPVVIGSEGEKAIDISTLRQKTGMITLDQGFMNTGSCTSAVTFIDGEKGVLRYRGYPIEELAEHSTFLETSYLLIYGELPTPEQFANFADRIRSFTPMAAAMKKMIDIYPQHAHPMAILSSMLGAIATFYPHLDKNSYTSEEMDDVIALIMGQLRVIAAYIYRKMQQKPMPETTRVECFCNSFLGMMYGFDYRNDAVRRALDLILVLHADHEQNCSTSTVRMVGSSLASPYSAIVAGIHALWGPSHGGANQEVIEMLQSIADSGGDYRQYIEKAKNKESGVKLMGFGHRVYKNFDPRAKILKKSCDEVLASLSVKDPVLEIARNMEEAVLQDPYFVERKLYPNVDFYSGIIYRALGIPIPMFTVMFALGRLPGWLAQWREQAMGPFKISRPRQIYVGHTQRAYVSKGAHCGLFGRG